MNSVETNEVTRMEDTHFVEVVAGNRKGTIAKVIGARKPNNFATEFQLEIDGRARNFWERSSNLSLLREYNGPTLYSKTDAPVKNFDFMGREIEIGDTIVFTRSGDRGAQTVLGTVSKITSRGAVHARAIKVGNDIVSGTPLAVEYPVGTPERALVMNKHTLDKVMMLKLTT